MKTRLLSLLLSVPVLIALFGGWIEAFTRSWHDGH